MKELKKLNLIEDKLNSSISKTMKKEILLANDYLKRKPRRYVLHLAETKSKIDSLKTKLDNSSLLYKKYSEEVDKIEKLFAKKIDIPQNHIQTQKEKVKDRSPERDKNELELQR